MEILSNELQVEQLALLYRLIASRANIQEEADSSGGREA